MPGSVPARAGVLLGLLAVLLVCCAATPGAQTGHRAEEFVLGDLRIPPPRGYVNDFAGILTREQARELENICRAIDRQTSAQVALVILPTVAGESVTDVRTRLFETWKIGDAKDDRGLLILHTLEERRIEVETGYGLEPILPDATVGSILSEAVGPSFRQDRFFEGYRSGLMAFGDRILAGPGAQAGQDAYRGRSGRGSGRQGRRGLPIGGILMGIVFLYLFIRHPRLAMLLLIMNMGGRRGSYRGGGGFGGGFGGFGGGSSGGGGAGMSY